MKLSLVLDDKFEEPDDSLEEELDLPVEEPIHDEPDYVEELAA